ncbi:MAG: cytidylate kinase-like family protein [Oscillospiraceae bacterium]|jgi:cytidylate kinase|nr:cytidylate kinase-like family protein [Oscillospiraceae bacterium]
MSSKSCITIGRQFGSGGREIGKLLAEKLNFPFYDRALISLAAKESGMDPELFAEVDETAANSLLYSLSMGLYSFGNGFSAMGDLPVNDRLYLLQHKIIKKIADEGPCVIVGRCGDYILREKPELISVFIHANINFRTQRAIEIHNIDKARAEQIVTKTDKRRANYYSFYSGQRWGLAEQYDLCIDSSKLTIPQAVDVIYEYVNIRNKK